MTTLQPGESKTFTVPKGDKVELEVSAVSPRLWSDPLSVLLVWLIFIGLGWGIGWSLGSVV